MPNRTIYLPEELDELSRRLGLNLSQLTQKAIEEFAEHHAEEALIAQVEAASAQAVKLGIDWPEQILEQQRAEAGER